MMVVNIWLVFYNSGGGYKLFSPRHLTQASRTSNQMLVFRSRSSKSDEFVSVHSFKLFGNSFGTHVYSKIEMKTILF